MPDMLNTAVSGLLAFQRALSTTSHNIANVNTDGYSRQRVDIGTNTPSFIGDVFVGNGVRVDTIERAYDQFLTKEVRDTTTVYARSEKFTALISHIDDLLADPQGGLSPALNDFFASVQDVADDPQSSTARYAMIGDANSMVDRFQSIDGRLEDLSQNTTNEVRNIVDDINELVRSKRDIKVGLTDSHAFGAASQQSSDLLDKRDALMTVLASKVDITVVNEQENFQTIMIGNGQTVLTNDVVSELIAQPNPADPARDVIVYDGVIQVFDMSDQLTGGELGGVLEFRQSILQPTRNALGRVAIGLAETFNAQMRNGMDQNNNLGQNFFSYQDPQVIEFTGNPGTSSVTAVVSNASALTKDDYTVSYDGTNWIVTSDSGNTSSVANGVPATLTFEGLTLTIDGTAPAVGDRFTIKPTLFGASTLEVLSTDPADIAGAYPIRVNASLNNLGDASIDQAMVIDPTNPLLLTTSSFVFDTPAITFVADAEVQVGANTYLAGVSIPYTEGMTISANGWQVNLAGTAQPGDVFQVEANFDGAGDNRNLLDLANLQNASVLDGGNASFQEDYGSLVGFIGSQTRAWAVDREAQESLMFQAIDRRSSKSGVNLDEEAADLIKFQQAYEATARIISTAQTMFETLLSSVR
jgi:flagellar hook-associated protein 1 FlgK